MHFLSARPDVTIDRIVTMDVLESIYLNNATYVFRDDWESLSKLSKSQIINGDVEYERVIHDSHWAENIGRILCL